MTIHVQVQVRHYVTLVIMNLSRTSKQAEIYFMNCILIK